MNQNENIRGNFVASEKLQKFFEAWLFDDNVKQKVKIAMGSQKANQIRNALRKDFADKLHKELYQSDHYVREGYHPFSSISFFGILRLRYRIIQETSESIYTS